MNQNTPEFWREMEQLFRELQPSNEEGLCADWLLPALTNEGDQWLVHGTTDKRVHQRFVRTVERAVLALGGPSGKAALSFWLDLLKVDSPNYRGTSGVSWENGVAAERQAGFLHRVCEASADYCFKLATDAAATVRNSTTKPQGAIPLVLRYKSELKRAILLQFRRNPAASGLEVCRGLDADEAVALPEKWKANPADRSFQDAYADRTRRGKIEKMISKVRGDFRNLR